MSKYPFPESTSQLIIEEIKKQRLLNKIHPGLYLDKLHESADSQENQKQILGNVVKFAGSDSIRKRLSIASKRYQELHDALNALHWEQKAVTPIALHLSRTNTLENAGTCLHPIYGFAYFPGSGLKGMARAYAETVWLPKQSDQTSAMRLIEDIFGWADTDDIKRESKQYAGGIVFLDAIPAGEIPPPLEVDIVNNHYSPYYDGKDLNQAVNAPGDWHSPVPVYFLAIQKESNFTFAVSKRNPLITDECLSKAAEFLQSALCYNGAGAKTNSGYGYFSAPSNVKFGTTPSKEPVLNVDSKQTEHENRKVATFQITLETPAFFAGANQHENDCELRPATLKGMLRWWWRTMHTGHLNTTDLRMLEAAIWGDSNLGGSVAINLRLIDQSKVKIEKFQFRNLDKRTGDRKGKGYYLDESKVNKEVKAIKIEKTTQGLFYNSYGMNEAKKRDANENNRTDNDFKSRYVMLPGAKWKVEFTFKKGLFFKLEKSRKDYTKKGKLSVQADAIIDVDTIRNEVLSAFWLLTNFGATGAKSRKGYGSVSSDFKSSLDECKKAAESTRKKCNLSSDKIGVSQLEQATFDQDILKIQGPKWYVMDLLGYCYQLVAKKYTGANVGKKVSLGLPRRKGDPLQKPSKFLPLEFLPLDNQITPFISSLLALKEGNNNKGNLRFSSPLHLHLKEQNGNYTLTYIAFYQEHLLNLKDSKQFLDDFKRKFLEELQSKLSSQPAPTGSTTTATGSPASPYNPNGFEVTLVEKKGDVWWARYRSEEPKEIINSDKVDKSKKAKHTVFVKAKKVDGRYVFEIQK